MQLFRNIVLANYIKQIQMKHLYFLVGLALLLTGCKSTTNSVAKAPEIKAVPANPVDYANTITAEELKEKLYIYASDDFEGRETGTPGQKKAVEYLKNHYVNLGVPSPLGADDYFQEVPLQKQKAPTMSMTINGNELKAIESFVSVYGGDDGQLNVSEIINLSYGIDDEAYSNYKDVDIDGKVVLIRSGEPKNEDGTYVITGSNEVSKWSNMRQQFAAKRDAAKNRGAKAVLFYYPEIYDRFAPRLGGSTGRLSLKGESNSMYFLMVNENVVKAIYNDENASMETAEKAVSMKAPMVFNYKNESDELQSENVISYIKGSTKPDEYIVISAHLDHEGVKDGQIYNGADDDGSGSVAILEIAEAFKAAADKGHGPERSIVFLHVTAEEKGLLGSRYYTDMDPIFPLENTVANLNIDMIGRTDPKRESENRNYVYLIGSDKLSTELHNLSEEVNAKYTNIELDYTYNDDNDPNRFYYRSDHYNFAKNNIPIIFYFNGTHADYHRPSDTVEKIQYDLLENRTKLVFYTAWELANRPSRVMVDKPIENAGN